MLAEERALDIEDEPAGAPFGADLHSHPRMLGPAGGERPGERQPPRVTRQRESVGEARHAQARTPRCIEEAWKSEDGILRMIVFMGAATRAALTLGGGAWLAGPLWRC